MTERTRQKTLGRRVRCSGVGLHSGRWTNLDLVPAEADSGIGITRTDLVNGAREIAADWRHVSDTRLATTLANDHGAAVSTVEHLMAALAGCEIDNLAIEIDGPEVPVMDGSAAPFVSLIRAAGVVEQDAPRKAIRVLKPVSVGDDERSVSVFPADGFSIDFEIGFDASAIDRQHYVFTPSDGTGGGFGDEISAARTFGMKSDVDALRAAGLGLGGSLENTVVVDGGRILNADGLRFGDEFVRHKILDCLGDLYLAGHPLLGTVRAYRSGHGLNNRLLRELFADAAAWETVETAAA